MVKKYKNIEEINEVLSALEHVSSKLQYIGEEKDVALMHVISKEWDRLYEYKIKCKENNMPYN